MAKDDYHVIVYKILAYLYVQLKNGADIEEKCLKHDGILFNINYRYWTYIMENMLEQGYITGITITKPWGQDVIIEDLKDCRITPDGIEYLCDNSFMAKVKQFMKDVIEITPFI